MTVRAGGDTERRSGAKGRARARSPAARPGRVVAFVAVAIGALTLAPFLASRAGPYHFDDLTTPVEDPASQSLSAFVAHVLHTLRPLSKLTFAVEGSLGWGKLPELRRAVSALIHASGASMLFVLLVRLRTPLVLAASLALAYGVHPLHAEWVLALAGRSALLAATLTLGSLLAFERGRARTSALLLALACLARETAILGLLPLAALALARGARPAPRGKVAWQGLRALEWHATAVLLLAAIGARHARYGELLDYSLHARPYAESVAKEVAAVPWGLSLAVRLGALTVDHGEAIAGAPGKITFASWDALSGIALLGGAIAGSFFAARAGLRRAAVGAAIVAAALLPTQSVIPKLDALTERPFAYALVGVAMLAAGAVARSSPGAWGRASTRLGVGIVGATVALGLGAFTVERGKLYATDLALWRDAAGKSVTNARPHYNYALALLDAGDLGGARREVARAIEIDPFDGQIRALYREVVARDVDRDGEPEPDLE